MILVLALIWAVFQVQEDRFLTSTNLTNLMLQMTGVALISIGVVLILLLGEIDLSVGRGERPVRRGDGGAEREARLVALYGHRRGHCGWGG